MVACLFWQVGDFYIGRGESFEGNEFLSDLGGQWSELVSDFVEGSECLFHFFEVRFNGGGSIPAAGCADDSTSFVAGFAEHNEVVCSPLAVLVGHFILRRIPDRFRGSIAFVGGT